MFWWGEVGLEVLQWGVWVIWPLGQWGDLWVGLVCWALGCGSIAMVSTCCKSSCRSWQRQAGMRWWVLWLVVAGMGC